MRRSQARALARASQIQMALISTYAGLTGLAFIAMVYAFQPATVDLVVTDWAGNVSIAGSGDTCAAAWENHAPFTTDWRSLTCEVR